MAVMSSPYKSAPDSPSRQLLWELGRFSLEFQEEFHAQLDEQSRVQEAIHKEALAAAVERHKRVRESAENARKELELRIEDERKRREAEERQELHKREQQKADRELAERRQEAERLKDAQMREQRREQARKADEAAAQTAREAKIRADDAARLEKERKESLAQKQALEAREAELKAKIARIAEEKKRTVPTAVPTTAVPNAPSTHPARPTVDPACQAEHQRYLAIHKNLKELRTFVMSESKKQNATKPTIGELRRQIRKSVGQLTVGQGANKTPVGSIRLLSSSQSSANRFLQLQNIIEALRLAMPIPFAKVDVSLFLATPPLNPPVERQISALVVYLLNVFAKAIVSQFIAEASMDPKQADPIGTVASHIFALDAHRWNNTTLIDILFAKLHVVCPVLFGIRGSEATNEGKIRLGWWREEKGGPFISDQGHNDRMTGLGAGFAAISLRNYERARHTNPYPPFNYWKAFSYIVNVPLNERTDTHCVVLKAMIDSNEERFLTFFGDTALVALRYAVLEYPREMKKGMGQMALAGLADTMRKDGKIRL